MNCLPPQAVIKNLNLISEHIKDPKFKTEMCKNWEKSSSCPYNNKCRFAHGKDEKMIKIHELNPNYRAKDCHNFFKFGFCNYGRRCCFKHDERKINEETQEIDIKILLKLRNPAEKKRLSVFQEVCGEIKTPKVILFKDEKVDSLNSTQEDINISLDLNLETCY